jgi:microcystin-dependent protein
MTEHWLTELRIFPFDSLPAGWVPCDGQLLPLDNAHMALFSLIGCTFGGDGRKNFAVPDLRGKVPVGGLERGKNVPSPSSEAGPKETQPTVALVYAICVDGMYPSTD